MPSTVKVVLSTLASQCATAPYIEYGTTYPYQQCTHCFLYNVRQHVAKYELVYGEGGDLRQPLCAKHAEQAERELRDARS